MLPAARSPHLVCTCGVKTEVSLLTCLLTQRPIFPRPNQLSFPFVSFVLMIVQDRKFFSVDMVDVTQEMEQRAEYIGHTGQCSPFGPLFCFLCYIHHIHTTPRNPPKWIDVEAILTCSRCSRSSIWVIQVRRGFSDKGADLVSCTYCSC